MYIKANSLFNGKAAENDRLKGQATQRKTIFAGDLPGMGQKKGAAGNERVNQIRDAARKKAAKVIGDVFREEKKMDEQITKMQDKSQELMKLRADSIEELKKIEERRAALAETEGVSEDSDLYKDLDKAALYHQNNLQQAESGISGIVSSLRDIRIELNKSDPMLKAQGEAEKIMEQAGKEIIGEYRKDGMKHVEEEIQKVVEEAKEKAEEKEEQEEKLEKIKEKKEELEPEKKAEKEPEKIDTVDLYDYADKKKSADKELERLIENLEMILDDLKGVEVDVSL